MIFLQKCYIIKWVITVSRLFTNTIKTENITFRHARGASIEQGKEFHTYHEIILFLEGDARLITEELNLDIAPNSLVVIPKENYHQLIIKSNQEDYYRMVINFTDSLPFAPLVQDSMTQVMILEAERKIYHIMESLAEKVTHPHKEALLQATLALLLGEITNLKEGFCDTPSQHPLIKQAVEYINSNLDKRLTIKAIALDCHCSPSALSHIFRKEMNIPLHQFIIKKRLIAANRQIKAGQAATTSAISLGFNDYSGFYKQYVKMFGHPPSKK